VTDLVSPGDIAATAVVGQDRDRLARNRRQQQKEAQFGDMRDVGDVKA
jgi:hypothetical protein